MRWQIFAIKIRHGDGVALPPRKRDSVDVISVGSVQNFERFPSLAMVNPRPPAVGKRGRLYSAHTS